MSSQIEQYYQNERGCECGFLPFKQLEDDPREDIIAKPGQIPSFDYNKNGQCECGFTPGISQSETSFFMFWKIDSHKMNTNLAKSCSVHTALRNHNTFPAADTLMKWNVHKKTLAGKRQHWCILLQIEQVSKVDDSLIVECTDLLHNYFKVYFDDMKGKTPRTFTWDKIKNGSTLAIMYPCVKKDENNDPEIHQTNLERCMVFQHRLTSVKHEAHMLMEDANCKDVVDSKCFCCGISSSEMVTNQTLSRCSRCKLAKYCSKKCQTYAWKTCHKQLCVQDEMLLKLTGLPVVPFNGFLSFEPESLPVYIPNYNMKVKSKTEAKLPEGVCGEDKKKMHDFEERIINLFIHQRDFMPKTEPTAKTQTFNNGSNKCGLCSGSSKKLIKTNCCSQWICDDRDDYVTSTRNSCWMNHERHSVCYNHFEHSHGGRWQNCRQCKREMNCFQYTQFATSRFSNFVRLEHLAPHPITCDSCGFVGRTLDDFCTEIRTQLFTTENAMKFTCTKRECMRRVGIQAV